jgi:hypothetical protein
LDTAGDAGFAFDEPVSFEGDHHLVDGWRGYVEVTLHVGFGGRSSEHAGNCPCVAVKLGALAAAFSPKF